MDATCYFAALSPVHAQWAPIPNRNMWLEALFPTTMRQKERRGSRGGGGGRKLFPPRQHTGSSQSIPVLLHGVQVRALRLLTTSQDSGYFVCPNWATVNPFPSVLPLVVSCLGMA